MNLVVAFTIGLVIWLVLWAIGVKSLDAFFIVAGLVLLTVVWRNVSPYLPGNRRDDTPSTGRSWSSR
jgi:hypothetical protein